jgi:hypothetical protein
MAALLDLFHLDSPHNPAVVHAVRSLQPLPGSDLLLLFPSDLNRCVAFIQRSGYDRSPFIRDTCAWPETVVVRTWHRNSKALITASNLPPPPLWGIISWAHILGIHPPAASPATTHSAGVASRWRCGSASTCAPAAGPSTVADTPSFSVSGTLSINTSLPHRQAMGGRKRGCRTYISGKLLPLNPTLSLQD